MSSDRNDWFESDVVLCELCGDTGLFRDKEGDECVCVCRAGADALLALQIAREEKRDREMEDQLQMMEFEDRISGTEDF